jgi:hypothetical protein
MNGFSKLAKVFILLALFSLFSYRATEAEDWQSITDRAVQLFKEYLSIDTTNPPGDVSVAAEFLHQIFVKEGISSELLWTLSLWIGLDGVLTR